MIHEIYVNRKNRDERARELRKEGYEVKCFAVYNKILLPEYIRDWREYYEKGVGNANYKTFHKVLYCLKARKGEGLE